MRIINLKAENIKRLKAIEIYPDKNLVEITGKNGAGKSSVLDAILFALAGKRATPDTVVNLNKTRGKIIMDLGEFIIERNFNDKGQYLKVVTKDGAEFPKAQTKLNELFEGAAFDPIEFMNKKEEDQIEDLLDLLGIKDKFDELKKQFEKVYDERTFVNRELKAIESKKEPLPEGVEEVSIVDLNDKKWKLVEEERSIEKFNGEVTLTKERTEEEKKKQNDLIKWIDDKQKEITEMQILYEETANKIREVEKSVPDLKVWEKFDELQEVEDQIDGAEEKNKQAQEYKRIKDIHDRAEQKRFEARILEKAIQQIKDDKEDLFRQGDLPIKGLSVERGRIVYNGIPLSEISQSEKIKISCLIAMKKNPKLKIMRVKDASLCDSETLNMLKKEVVDQDYQLWFETIESDSESAIVIEDGEVKQCVEV